jgi:hypothetical protein
LTGNAKLIYISSSKEVFPENSPSISKVYFPVSDMHAIIEVEILVTVN